ncbi:MAG: cyclic nucleotide-binding domain-containing protein [Gammaproteobacteria bacterium]|nr:cyclic nucleotide-binding domain-containing protein [Gammaproteobacteria bacterium]
MTSEELNLVDFINQQKLSESLTIKEVQTFIDYTEVVVFSKGEVIADIGEVGEALYFVIDGVTALYYEDAGEETEVGKGSRGELMGEMSFFDREPRSVRIKAIADNTRLLKLSRKMYSRLRIEHPFIAVNLLEHAIVSLDHLFRQISSDVATFSHMLYGKGKH